MARKPLSQRELALNTARVFLEQATLNRGRRFGHLMLNAAGKHRRRAMEPTELQLELLA